jgi:hypothetical protein
MSLLPPPVIGTAIVAGLAMPIMLVLLSWGPQRWRHSGRRFKVSVLTGWILWGVLAVALPGIAGAHPLDWLAGAAVLVAATLVTFNAWSLPAYGVTLNMLVTLARADRPLDLETWADRYSGGRSIDRILLDRLGHLVFFKLARRDGDVVHLLPGSSRFAVAILKIWYFIFGLARPR